MRNKIMWILIALITVLVVINLIPAAVELWDTDPPWRAAAVATRS